ncbi:MAG: ABC transporter ATP-binding protein [Oscillospiraceae bacterium]|nr:ABC transporter ATP-binding protein [Oscillospiraceae bacterium]
MKLEVRDLVFGYDETRRILDGVSFTLEGSGIFCILGQNGTGKSTLLKCLVGEEKAEGSIRMDGRELSSYTARERARKIAYLPQTHVPSFPFRTLDVVMMGRSAHMRYFASPGSEEEREAMKNLEFLGIAHLKDKPYTDISGGERQLVLLAAALTQDPELLILDEPTSHLDFGNSHRFLELVSKLHGGGMAVLMTTHFPDHALYLNASTLVLKGGCLWLHDKASAVVREDTMTELYKLPVHISRMGGRQFCIAGELEEGGAET